MVFLCFIVLNWSNQTYLLMMDPLVGELVYLGAFFRISDQENCLVIDRFPSE
jgi:hypothetical protein